MPLVGAGTPGSYTAGWYNPWIAGQLAWDLGHGLGVSYALGFYAGVSSPVADHSGSLNQRFAISYTANGYNLSANLIYGNQISSHTNPDFLNLDLTATKAFGKWSFGPVGYYSTDTSTPFSGYLRQSQFALGVLVGYDFGPVIMQTYLTGASPRAITVATIPASGCASSFRWAERLDVLLPLGSNIVCGARNLLLASRPAGAGGGS